MSRLTVYNQFKSKDGLLNALAAEALAVGAPQLAESKPGSPLEQLEQVLEATCARWASDPALFRRLPAIQSATDVDEAAYRHIAERLADADQLRAGCSIKEAEDVIALLTSFPAFDHLHKDGRRSTAAVTGILTRLAAAILA